ncbi:MAG: hypothetical protein ABSB36_02415 [Candidatus Dormibacteria bacterium]
MGRTRRLIASWALGMAALAAAGCGSTSTSVATPATAAPTATGSTTATTPTATSTTVSGVTGGAGDTSANPDQTFVCGASGTIDGSLVAYLTVAGTDSTSAKSLCSSLEGAAGWVAITTISAGEYESVPECYVTLGGGVITARIYTAKGGSDAETKVLCDTLLAGSTLPTLAP